MIKPESCYSNDGNREVLAAIPSSAKKILDLGCGAGNMARQADGNGRIWDGITISPDEAERARPFYRNMVIHDLEDGLPGHSLDGDYDVCVCSHVIEHIVWPQKLLKDIRSVVAPSMGVLIAAVPNVVNHEIRMKILRGKFDYRSSGILDVNHVRWYTFHSIQQLLVRNGYGVIKAWAEGKVPIGRAVRRRFPSSALVPLDRLACRLFPGFFGYQLLCVAKPITYKL